MQLLLLFLLQILITVNAEPHTIVEKADSIHEPENCPSAFGPYECKFNTGDSSRRHNFPEVLAFNFISIEWIENDSYQVMLEFDIVDAFPKTYLKSITIVDLHTPGNYLPDRVVLYTRDNPSDVSYHFFFKWVMKSEYVGHNRTCTTPFHIEYEWDFISVVYEHGCFGEYLDYPLQCWDQVCVGKETFGESNEYVSFNPITRTLTDNSIFIETETLPTSKSFKANHPVYIATVTSSPSGSADSNYGANLVILEGLASGINCNYLIIWWLYWCFTMVIV